MFLPATAFGDIAPYEISEYHNLNNNVESTQEKSQGKRTESSESHDRYEN